MYRMRPSRHSLSTCFLAMLLALFMHSAFAEQRPELIEMPTPDLDALPAPAREAIRSMQEGFDQARTEAEDDEALAVVYAHAGRLYHAHGVYSAALTAYRNASSLDPHNAEWQYLRAYMEERAGSRSVALVMYSLTLHLQPGYVPALIRRGRLYLGGDDLESAGEDFERALQINPSSAAALAGLGMIYHRVGDSAQAAELMERALEMDPEATNLHDLLGLAYMDMDDLERARYHMSRSGTRRAAIPDPILDLVRSLSTDPSDQFERGLRHAGAGNLDSAVSLLGRAAEQAPDNPEYGRVYAVALARRGDAAEARQEIRRVLELDAEDPENHMALGQILELDDDSEAALAAYRDAIALDEDSLDKPARLADALMRAGDFEAAGEQYRALADAFDDAETAMHFTHWYGLSQIAIGNCRAAADILASIEEETTFLYAPALLSLARLRATCLNAEGEALEEALGWVEEVYNAEPGLEAAEALAMVHAAMGSFEDAEDLQAQAIFEAVRTGQGGQHDALRENMQRYEEERRAARPYSAYQLIPSL